MSIEQLFKTTKVATLGDVAVALDCIPSALAEWADDNGVAKVGGHYVFSREEAVAAAEDLEDEDEDEDDDEDEDEDDEDEDEDDEDDDAEDSD